MITSTLTSKGQTTVPVEVRRALGLKPRQRIIYEVRGGKVTIKPETTTIMDFYGAGKKTGVQMGYVPMSEIRKVARRMMAENAAREGLE